MGTISETLGKMDRADAARSLDSVSSAARNIFGQILDVANRYQNVTALAEDDADNAALESRRNQVVGELRQSFRQLDAAKRKILTDLMRDIFG